MASDYGVTVDELGFDTQTTLVAFEAAAPSSAFVVDHDHSLLVKKCGQTDFQLYTLSPRSAWGWALLGEQGKWVSVSEARFSDVAFDSQARDVWVHTDSRGSR